MHDGIDVHIFKDPAHTVDIVDIDDVKRNRFRDGCPMAAGQVVDDDDLMAFVKQGLHRMAADIAGTAGN
ncbi:hypothetical protein HMPREF3201_00925 [Megasphaera sp. MJR8396C]|nr:hypothetical protein HMPREF3201_00925 [Megasphaera sp. MJR8396C]